MPRKSLAEELAVLANPAPTKEFDPEDDVFGAGPTLEASDDDLQAAPLRRRGKEQARLHGDITMEGKEYAGRRSSRNKVFETYQDNTLFDPEASGSDQSGGSEDEDNHIDAVRQASRRAAAGGAHASDEALSESDSEESGSEDEAEALEPGSDGDQHVTAGPGRAATGGGDDDDDDEMAALEREYEAVQAAELEAAAGLRERAARERRKAVAVAAQHTVWQRALEARILLQRALQGAHRLPRGATHAAVADVDPELAAQMQGLAADAAGLLEDLLAVIDGLEERNPAVAEAAQAAGVKRKRAPEADAGAQGGEAASDRLWARMDATYRAFAPFRDASLDRWHRKTVLAAGGAIARGGLRALNQSVSSQVAMVMQDARRMVQRTRLPRGRCAVLCSMEGEATKGVPPTAADGADQRASGEAAGGGGEDRDPETYDDTDFYQTLLKEFLEGSGDAGATSWHSRPKHRKAVDRRASKGRKLRYHIHDKLVNFVAPVELQAPRFAPSIFANLFGGGA